MATSSPEPVDASAPPKRASGRVRKQTEIYAPTPSVTTTKRKRGPEPDEDGDVDMDGADAEEDEEDDEDEDGEPDEEEVRAQKKRNRKPKSTAPKKPAAKKPKVNGTSLPIRGPATTIAKKKSSKKRGKLNTAKAKEAGGLYADIFASNDPMDAVIARWLKEFDDDEAPALASVVNFVLKCIGCDSEVDRHAIEDPDGITNKIDDLREEYQRTNPTDYPLILKNQAAIEIREGLSEFFQILIRSIAAKGQLTEDSNLIENLLAWFSAMSSAPNRPFRHTATVVSFNIISGLCQVAKQNAVELANDRTQLGKGRKAKQYQERIKAKETAQETYDNFTKDWFETVFLHRYRDVDPAIRQDAMASLGGWIQTHGDVFFDGAHLRYFGWVLGDQSPHTRLEVITQLLRLYKDNDMLGGLRTFTEKFRPRMVEMATTDADIGVRAASLELLVALRVNGMLEPDDIDAVGQLIFDQDARIRKAVAGFFAQNVEDSFFAKVEDLGGEETLTESLPDVGDDDHDSPKLAWLKLKALAEMLSAYDADDELPSQVARTRSDNGFLINVATVGSRFLSATEMLYDSIKEAQSWQTIAGYLLFDHSSGQQTNGHSGDALESLKQECILTDKEEMILLETLNTSVKRTLTDIAAELSHKGKLTKKQREDAQLKQEETAHHLATLIPQLLSKFGDVPSTAGSVLRMESVLSLPSLRDLRQDSATYAALLDDVRKQFMSHGTDEVLGPASNAILHAKSYGEVDDLTEERIVGLWEDVTGNLSELINIKTLTVRGASDLENLTAMSNNLLRIIRLAQVSDCSGPLEDNTVSVENKSTGQKYDGAIDLIIALISRATPSTGPVLSEQEAYYEDEIAARAAEAALFYFRWKVRAVIEAVTATTSSGYPDDELITLAERRDRYVDDLKAALQSRKAKENVSLALAGNALEMLASAAILRQVEARPGISDDYTVLACDMDEDFKLIVMKVFAAAERTFARLGGKNLAPSKRPKAKDGSDDEAVNEDEDEAVAEDPLSDPESSSDEEEDAAAGAQSQTQTQASIQRRENKILQALLAEQRLCSLAGKIVQAVFANVLDEKVVRKRLERNKMRLGQNYRECVGYLDSEKGKRKGAKKGGKKKGAAEKQVKGGAAATKKEGKKSAKSNAIIAPEDESDDEIEDGDEEEEDDEEALARKGLDDRPEEEGEEEEENRASEERVGVHEQEDSVMSD